MEENISGAIPNDQIQELLGPGRRLLWRESSLHLANMGQDEGLKWQKLALTTDSFGSGSPAGHCAIWGGWCIFNEVT